MRILLAGGAGYIGSHTAVELIERNNEVIILDNYSNSDPEVLNRIKMITKKNVNSFNVDIKDKEKVSNIFKNNNIDVVVHFAGLKAVQESIKEPLKYYRNNIDTTLTLLECMKENDVNKFVFSSSATVYGKENCIPYIENMSKGTCTNPYGWTKSMIEQIIEDECKSNKNLSAVVLRYFNPIGAHKSGLLGEDPTGVPNNLMPFITQVAVGEREELVIFGDDYNTPDGTCRRDYIHILDLAKGHVKAIEYAYVNKGIEVINLGTGHPYSVFEIVNSFEKVNNLKIKKRIGQRREGDLDEFWANVEKSKILLGWTSEHSLDEMCKDSWRWQIKNPKGYRGK
ncbi:MAG: UDP-glucose 4-epimerase GalE [Finegoldia magna]|nr:UDP-glucose 4-epimerase GalE [Finegoldia magna]